MMVIGLLLLATKGDAVDETLLRIGAAHDAFGSAVFTATSRTVVEGTVQSIRYEVGYQRPGDFTIKQITDGSSDPVRILAKSGKTMMVYDPKTKQYARRIFQGDVSVKEAIGASGLQVDPLVMAIITPGGMKEWVKQFQQLSNWNLAPSGSNWKLTLKSSAGEAALDIQSSSGRLAGLHAKVNNQTTDWTLSYPSGKPTPFSPPSGSFEVAMIDPSLINPTFADASARRAVEKMFRAYDKPQAIAVQVTSDTKKYSVWYRPGAVRQADGNTDWSLVQGELTVVDHGTTYKGRSTVRETIDRLPRTRSRAEPITRALMQGQNYFRLLLGSGEKVRLAGKTKIEGADCTILTANGRVAEYTLIVRDSDGFVLSLSTRPLGDKASIGSETSFSYMPTNGVTAGRDLLANGVSRAPHPISELQLSKD